MCQSEQLVWLIQVFPGVVLGTFEEVLYEVLIHGSSITRLLARSQFREADRMTRTDAQQSTAVNGGSKKMYFSHMKKANL